MRATYRDIHAAADAVSAIMAQPVTPCALEFMDGAALDMVREFSGLELSLDVGALLMIEVDGPAHCLAESVDAVQSAARNQGTIDIQTAESEEEIAQLWKARESLSPALRSVAPKKINEDVVVPVSRIPELIDGLSTLSKEMDIRIVNFGHAGNGNIHVNLLLNPDDPAEMARGEECLDAMFDLVLRLNGTISGEHGVGLLKRGFVARELDPVALRLMLDIKQQFDPDNILNPGKMLPELP
jgi:D-lactate dehydrogenase